MNFGTPALLAKHGFRYDSALDGFGPPVSARGAAPTGGGAAPTLIELPVHWSLDDWNRWNYVPGYASSPILRPSDVEADWTEELEAIVEVGGLFNLTMHPFISGRPSRAAAIERLIERARSIDGLWSRPATRSRPGWRPWTCRRSTTLGPRCPTEAAVRPRGQWRHGLDAQDPPAGAPITRRCISDASATSLARRPF